jgi:uncharacterized protein YjiS (DUF1127 family)
MNTAIRRWRELRRFRTTVRELQTLSPRELRDLGIRRAEITRLAARAARL